VARYDAEIAFFDEQFGRLIRFLKESGFYADSMIVLTADHGEEFFDHGGWDHGQTLYNEVLRVPMIVKYPTSAPKSPARADHLVGLVDVAATVKDLLHATWPTSSWRGRSMLEPGIDRTVYAENGSPALRALYSRSGKLIQALGPENRVMEEEYYSLESELDESENARASLSDVGPELDQMRSSLEEIYRQRVSATEADLDAETIGELRALGYIE
jgi:arylsulfatase A-like enzyme